MRQTALLAIASWLAVGCGSKTTTEELPSFPVRVAMGAILPERVGDYELNLDEGFFVFADWAVYGAPLGANVETFSLDGPILAHAGHQHGAAELSGSIDGSFAVDLLAGRPQELGTIQLKEGHYFDGRLRLVTGDSSTRWLEGGPLAEDSPVWSHTFYLAGTASLGQEAFPFTFVVDVEATVPGLAYARTVREGGKLEIVTRLDLGAVLEGVDFEALADPDGSILVDPTHHEDTYALLKARLSDPENYVQDDLEASE